MNDVFLILGVVGCVTFIVGILTIVEKLTTCSHKWGDWSYKEDSACFIQKRQCVKCQYTEFQQIRKVTNAPE